MKNVKRETNPRTEEEIKKHRNKKRLKRRKLGIKRASKNFCIVLLVQILLAAVFFYLMYKPTATQENVEYTSFYASMVRRENIFGLHPGKSWKGIITIYNGSHSYKYYGKRYDLNISEDNIIDMLQTEKLELHYLKGTNIITDIKCDKTVFYTMEDFNKEREHDFIDGIIASIIFELVFALSSFAYVWEFVDAVRYYIGTKKQIKALEKNSL